MRGAAVNLFLFVYLTLAVIMTFIQYEASHQTQSIASPGPRNKPAREMPLRSICYLGHIEKLDARKVK